MTRERQLRRRREDAHASRCAGHPRLQHERRLRQVELAGDLLQLHSGQIVGIKHDRQWIVQLRNTTAQPWRNAAYWRRRLALIGDARRRAGALPLEAEDVLLALPETHP